MFQNQKIAKGFSVINLDITVDMTILCSEKLLTNRKIVQSKKYLKIATQRSTRIHSIQNELPSISSKSSSKNSSDSHSHSHSLLKLINSQKLPKILMSNIGEKVKRPNRQIQECIQKYFKVSQLPKLKKNSHLISSKMQ